MFDEEMLGLQSCVVVRMFHIKQLCLSCPMQIGYLALTDKARLTQLMEALIKFLPEQ